MKLKNRIDARLTFSLKHALVASAVLCIVIVTAIAIGLNLSNSKVAFAAPGVNLNQGKNGSDSLPISPMTWVNGNLSAGNAHYAEGWSAPYQCIMTGLTSGTQVTLTIGYDIRNSSKNAFDYLTNHNRLNPHNFWNYHSTPETIDPLSGSGLSSSVSVNTYTIPAPSSTGSLVSGQPGNSYASLTASERLMTIYNGTIDSIYYVTQGSLSASNSETRVAIKFTPAGTTAVLAWGGHIASRGDWGITNGSVNSAAGISGSPFHMRLIGWTQGSLGNQDRSIAGGIVSPLSVNLPVELLSFTARPQGNQIIIDWATASEINNAYFTVERSKDGRNFLSMATVAGAGNSTSVLHYNWSDENPLEGLTYYRIKQTDYDGKTSYSPIRAVRFSDKSTDGIAIASVSPNPFKDDFTLNYTSSVSGMAEILLVRTQGKILNKEIVNVVKGANSYHFSTQLSLTSGIYYVEIVMNGKRVSQKLICI